jgi:hypothetical protein
LLNIARLKVVQNVGNLQPAEELDAVSVEFEVERILDLCIDTDVCGKSTGFVAHAHVVPINSHAGVRKSGVNVNDGNELNPLREMDDAPEKDSIRGIVGQRTIDAGGLV